MYDALLRKMYFMEANTHVTYTAQHVSFLMSRPTTADWVLGIARVYDVTCSMIR